MKIWVSELDANIAFFLLHYIYSIFLVTSYFADSNYSVSTGVTNQTALQTGHW